MGLKKDVKKDILEQACSQVDETIERVEALNAVFDKTIKMHEKGGVCYTYTETLLALFRKFKYYNLRDAASVCFTNKLIREQGELPDGPIDDDFKLADIYDCLLLSESTYLYGSAMKRFLSSRKLPFECALVNLIEIAISKMETMGKTTKELAKILEVTYLDVEHDSIDADEIYNSLKMSKPTYYRKREKAITALSTFLFNPLASGVESSPFYSSQDEESSDVAC